MNKSQALHYESLKRGYAVAFSSGTSSATHYNIKLAGETAVMLKQHFVSTYGSPEYTIGIGGSGGAIQQYLIAQNNGELLDGIIPQLSYPDMITQISYVADCDLLERYFDGQLLKAPESKWGSWEFRSEIEGLNINRHVTQPSAYESAYAPSPGASTCSRSWRGHVQTIMNPDYAHPAYQKALKLFRYPETVIQNIKWTHWNDLANYYPQDKDGFAYSTWDNAGVQYGLSALLNGAISVDEFLELNACVGSWKTPAQMRLGDYPWNPAADKNTPDPWDQANMNLEQNCKTGTPAPRSNASAAAIQAASSSGHIFKGKVNLPTIDIRWYLDPVLDIHHALGSFSARARIIHNNGNADNHIIWFVACDLVDPLSLETQCEFDPTGPALDAMGHWLDQGKQPDTAVDSCFDNQGDLIYRGQDAWNSVLDNNSKGPCAQQFPVYATSRMIAGEHIRGDTLKCNLKTVATAINDGSYGNIHFTKAQIQRLKEIFSTGVCDYQ